MTLRVLNVIRAFSFFHHSDPPLVVAERRRVAAYLPMQKRLKMVESISSGVTLPVMVPR